MERTGEIDVSVIIPVHNGANYILECLMSVINQTYSGSLEVSIYDDGSTDDTLSIVKSWAENAIKSKTNNLIITISGHSESSPKGVGYAKNMAVKQSRGMYLCFLDADDVADPNRIHKQWHAALSHPLTIIGSRFERIPPGSTPRFTTWANNLTPEQLYTQAYLSHGPTVIMPTWFCSRKVFESVGGFDESGKVPKSMGTPEDLIFFYKHLDQGGKLHRIDDILLYYRHYPNSMTFSISEDTIWKLRIDRFQSKVLCHWSRITIWNAGKQGRKFYRSLSDANKRKVEAFCDVDSKKIAKGFYTFEETKQVPKPKIPILHFTQANSPFIICVKLGLTNGNFEDNLKSLKLQEGRDYYHFN